MRTPLRYLSMIAVALATAGCQSSNRQSSLQANAGSGDMGFVSPNLLFSDVAASQAPSSAADGDTFGPEDYRNDSEYAASIPENRRWLITRQYENLRISNGRPCEYSSFRTQAVTIGPGR